MEGTDISMPPPPPPLASVQQRRTEAWSDAFSDPMGASLGPAVLNHHHLAAPPPPPALASVAAQVAAGPGVGVDAATRWLLHPEGLSLTDSASISHGRKRLGPDPGLLHVDEAAGAGPSAAHAMPAVPAVPPLFKKARESNAVAAPAELRSLLNDAPHAKVAALAGSSAAEAGGSAEALVASPHMPMGINMVPPPRGDRPAGSNGAVVAVPVSAAAVAAAAAVCAPRSVPVVAPAAWSTDCGAAVSTPGPSPRCGVLSPVMLSPGVSSIPAAVHAFSRIAPSEPYFGVVKPPPPPPLQASPPSPPSPPSSLSSALSCIILVPATALAPSLRPPAAITLLPPAAASRQPRSRARQPRSRARPRSAFADLDGGSSSEEQLDYGGDGSGAEDGDIDMQQQEQEQEAPVRAKSARQVQRQQAQLLKQQQEEMRERAEQAAAEARAAKIAAAREAKERERQAKAAEERTASGAFASVAPGIGGSFVAGSGSFVASPPGSATKDKGRSRAPPRSPLVRAPLSSPGCSGALLVPGSPPGTPSGAMLRGMAPNGGAGGALFPLVGPPVSYMHAALAFVAPPDELPRPAPGVKSAPSAGAAMRAPACVTLQPPPPPALAASACTLSPAGQHRLAGSSHASHHHYHAAQRGVLGLQMVRTESAPDPLPVVVIASRYRPLHRWLYDNVSVVALDVPDLVPGDQVRSMLRWLRHCGAHQACPDFDAPLHTSYEHRYRQCAGRSRRMVQHVTLHPEDPMTSPNLCPGPRPPDPAERLAALLVQQAMTQRRSERERVAPRKVYDPSHIPNTAHASASAAAGGAGAGGSGTGPTGGRKSAANMPKLLLGEDFQAVCPRFTAMPSELSASELSVLGRVVHLPTEVEPESSESGAQPSGQQGEEGRASGSRADGIASSARPQPLVFPVTQSIAVKTRERLSTEPVLLQRHFIMDDTVKELDKKLGDVGKVLGMSLMGSKTQALWQPKDECAFACGVRTHDREFELIQRDFLPHKTMSQLIAYYYNIWKIRYTVEADEWHKARRARKDAVPAAPVCPEEPPEPPSSEPEPEPDSE